MHKLLWIMLVALNAVNLTACREKQEESMAYYMQHPRVVSSEAVKCQGAPLLEQSGAHCRLVMEAASQIMELIEAHQRDPQAFGQRILAAEMKSAKPGENQQEVNTLLAVVGLSSPE